MEESSEIMKLLSVILSFVFIFMTGCAPKVQFVLLPDPDGKVGTLEVSNKGGTQIVDQAGQMTGVSSAGQRPSQPKKLDPKIIESVFGQALAMEPKPVERFVLYFSSGGIQLTDESNNLLSKVYTSIELRDSNDISIVGHSDKQGKASDNLKLSRNRAQIVGELLEARGVDPENIEITSHGENNPLIDTPDGVAELKNRKVEIIVR